jgi:type IV pilus assembly protein PilM
VQEALTSAVAGEDRWLEHTKAALVALAERTAVRGRVTLVLPPHITLAKIIRVPQFERGKREKVIRFAAEEAIPCPLADVVWDHVAAADHDLEVMLAAVKRGPLEELCAGVRAAGFEIGAVLPASLGTLAAFRMAPHDQEPTLLLNIGARSTSLLIVSGNRFVVRTIACGAQSDSFAMRLVQEVTRSVLFFRRQGGWPEPVRICLTGGGARSAGLAAALAAGFKLPVGHLELAALIDGELAGAELTDLTGAAATRLCPGHPAMNLIPSSLRPMRVKRPLQVAGATLAVAVAVWPLLPERQRFARRVELVQAAEPSVPPAPVESVAPVLAEMVSEATPPRAADLSEVDPKPCPLRIAGYFAGPEGYQVVFAGADDSPMLVRSGHRFESLGLTLRGFEVKKVAVTHADAWPVYEIVAFARLQDERTGREIVLDDRAPRT